jgi:flagellar biosynthesis chaperone FliJ
MAKFKEQKRQSIEVAKEKGDGGLAQGEQRVRELQSVKSMIDSIYDTARDEDTREQVKMMEQQYREAGREAHRNEVDSVVRSARDDLERNKSDIADERSRTESSISRIGDMRGVTDLARNEARSAEGNLQRSADEFKNMESTTENIEAEQESRSQNTLSRIESIFG